MGESTQRAYGVRLKKFRKRKNGKDRPPVFPSSHGATRWHGALSEDAFPSLIERVKKEDILL
jgi:hypothetical protein